MNTKSTYKGLDNSLLNQSKRFTFEPLEPRVMLSADPVPVGMPDDPFDISTQITQNDLLSQHSLIPSYDVNPSNLYPHPLEFSSLNEGSDSFNIPELGTYDVGQLPKLSDESSTELIIVDAGVDNVDGLLNLINTSQPGTNYEIHLLNDSESGLEQIDELLSGYDSIAAVHVFSHGSGDGLQLGDQWVTESTLNENAALLNDWSAYLDSDADILLYGCELASSQTGIGFINALQSLTQADIAASDDQTGNLSQSSDWLLEHHAGQVEHLLTFNNLEAPTWQGNLAIYNVTITTDVLDGGDGELSLREAVIAANANGGTDTINLAADTYTLTLTSGPAPQQSDLDVLDSINIVGAGVDQTFIDAGDNFQLIEFHTGSGTSNVSNLTLQNATQVVGVTGTDVTVNLTDIEIKGASTTGFGGGIYNGGTMNLERVTISNSVAQWGGGIYNDTTGDMTLINVTISGNAATFGGGVYNTGNMDLTNVTIAKNIAGNAGGGFYSSSGTVNLSNTVIADNTAGVSSPDVVGAFVSDGFNFIGDKTGATGLGSDLTGDAKLDVLAAGAGETSTHAILAGSSLIGAGTDAGAPTEDQRGVSRVGTTDIGAYEYPLNSEPTLSITTSTPTFTEAGAAVSVFSAADVNTVDTGQSFQALTLTITNVTETGNEVINISGVAITLDDLEVGVVAGFAYSVGLVGTTATVTLSGGSATNAAMNTLLNSITYQNNSQDPTVAVRRITIESIQDDGGVDGAGDDTLNPAVFSDVSVQAVNNLATLGNNTLTLVQSSTTVLDASILSATDVDNDDTTLVFNVTNVTNGYFALTSDTTTAITSFTQAQITAASVVFIHDGGELEPNYDVSVFDGSGSSVAASASISFTGTSDGVLWLSIEGDEGSGNGVPGLDGSSIDKGDVLQHAGPDFAMGEGGTDGTFSVAFDISQFSTDDDINGMHYVTSSVSIGLTNTIVMQSGDLILSSAEDMTLVSNGAGAPADLDITKEDIFYFRPDNAGDYSQGNFYLLLSDPFQDGAEITGLSLVEQDVWIGDYQLKEGDLLLSRNGGGEESDIWLLKTDTLNTALPASYPTALQLINGEDVGLDIDRKVVGIDILETDKVIGGQSYDAGTLFLAFDSDDNDGVGSNTQLVESHDIVALSVTKTTLVAGADNASATASLLFDGDHLSDNDVNFDSGNEKIDGFSFTHETSGINNPPSIDTNSLNLVEGATVTVTSAMLSSTDTDNADGGLTYSLSSILGGEFQLTTNLGVAVTSFTQSQIDNNEVIFIDNGDETAPSFSFTVSDGTNTTAVTPAVIAFTLVNDEPTLSLTASNATFTEGGSAASIYTGANASTIESGDSFIGLTLTVTNVTDGASEILNIDGAAISLTNGNSGSSTGFNYSVSVSGTTATVTLSSGTATEAQMNTLLDGMSYQNNDADPTAAGRVVTLTALQDSGGTANSGDDTLAPNVTSTVTVQGVNDEPTLSLTASNATFTEGGSAASIYTGANASTIESGDSFIGLTLTVTNVTDGASEILNIDGAAISLTNGNSGSSTGFNYSVSVSGTTATVTLSAGTATEAQMNSLLNGMSYQNNDADPTAAGRVVTLTALQDSGGTANSGDDTLAPNVTSTVTVQGVNDEPILSLTASNATFTEGGSAASIYTGANASTIESCDSFIGLTLTVTNVTDGASEILNIDGAAISLTNGNSGSSTGFNYSVSVSGTTATVTLSAGTATEAQMNTLLDGMSYQNNDADPTAAGRVVTLTALQDSGGTANSGDDTLAPNVASTVTVQGVNDEPTLSLTASNATFTEGGSAASIYTGANASTIESGDSFIGLTLTITNITDGASEILNIDGAAIALTNGNSGSSTGFNYSVSLSGTTATVTLSAGTATEAQMNSLLNGMSYQNNDADPTEADRVVTLTALQDSGGTANSGDDTLTPSVSSTVTVQGVNALPLMIKNGFVLEQGETVILGNSNLSATDGDDADVSLVYTLSSVSGGHFEKLSAPGVAISSFTQAEINSGLIKFIDDNDLIAPSFKFSVSDGEDSSGPFNGNISFSPAPVIEEPEIEVEVVELEEIIEDEEDENIEEVVESAEEEIVVEESDANDEDIIVQRESEEQVALPENVTFDLPLPKTEPTKISLVVAEKVASISQLKASWSALSDPLLLLKSNSFMDSLTDLDNDIQRNITLDSMVLGSGAAVSTGLSIGYVAWLLRSGIILTSVLSSLPAWRFIDPLPVLSRMGEHEDDQESLEDMVSKKESDTPESDDQKA